MLNTEQTVPSTKPKEYLPGETPEQRKHRLRREKGWKKEPAKPAPQSSSQPKKLVGDNFVVCLKWGDKYSADYVNKLHNMVARNLTLPYKFVCFTENKNGLDPDILTFPLPELPVKGWWYKPYFLGNDLPLKGNILFLDLDLIVFNNIDKLFTYKPNAPFVIIRDFNRQVRKNWDRVNSSVFRIQSGAKDTQYQEFVKRHSEHTKRMPGDQDWMYRFCKPYEYWPDEWIQSYKWEMRGRQTLTVTKTGRNFKEPGEPIILPDTSIAVFHGKPDIHEAVDEWPRKNWY